MKKWAIFIFLTVLLLNCTDNIKIKNKNKGSTYEEIIDNELKKNVRNDEVFLGYSFGMTENQFDKKTKELIKNKTIYSDNGYLTYDLLIYENTICKSTFSPEYYNNKLHKLEVSVKHEFFKPSTIVKFLITLFWEKYHSFPDIEKKSYVNKNVWNYIWIDGNRMIELMQGYDDVRIFYTDLIAQKEKDKIEINENTIKKNESIKNL